MSELFHPDLPGQSMDAGEGTVAGWGQSGWLPWDELPDDAKAAHEEAVAAQAALMNAAAGNAALEDFTNALSAGSAEKPPRQKPKDTNQAPGTGETPKE